jgi:hypothetical protein
VDSARTPRGVAVRPQNQSYDGQFFYRLALSPFSTAEWDHGVRFDVPALRASRITYPLLARAVTLGHDRWVPAALLVVNVLATAVLGLGGSLLARRAGRRWWLGLVVVLIPGAIYGAVLDLADVVALALAVFALGAVLDHRWVAAGTLFALAALTRESTLLLVVASAVVLVSEHRARRHRGDPVAASWPVVVIPAVVYGGWQLAVHHLWGRFSTSGSANFGAPFAALVGHLDLFVPRDGPAALRLFVLGLVLGVVAAAVPALVDRAVPPLAPIGVAIGAVLFASLSVEPFTNYVNFARAASELLLLALVGALWSRRPSATVALILAGGGGAVLALWSIWATTPLP